MDCRHSGMVRRTRPQMRNCASGNLEIPGSSPRDAPGMTLQRHGADRGKGDELTSVFNFIPVILRSEPCRGASLEGCAARLVAVVLRGSPKGLAPQDDGDRYGVRQTPYRCMACWSASSTMTASASTTVVDF